MIAPLPVGVTDIVRLFVEAVEECELGRTGREELIRGFRKAVRMGVQAIKDAERTQPFGKVVEQSLAARAGRRKSTLADLRSYTGRMVGHADWADKPLRGISAEDCRQMLHAVFGHSPNAFRKGRTILHSIFNYGLRQGWCEKNPVQAIEIPRVMEKHITPLKSNEIQQLLAGCKNSGMQDMEPAVMLMLWCGVRPGEVQRLRWGDIDSHDDVVYVDGNSSKTGGARLIPLRGHASSLSSWALQHAPEVPLAPRNWAKRWRDLRKVSGLGSWQQDALRHTFASMHMRRFRNPPQLQAEMGHRDSDLLRTRYVDLRHLSSLSADRFWASPAPAPLPPPSLSS